MPSGRLFRRHYIAATVEVRFKCKAIVFNCRHVPSKTRIFDSNHCEVDPRSMHLPTCLLVPFIRHCSQQEAGSLHRGSQPGRHLESIVCVNQGAAAGLVSVLRGLSKPTDSACDNRSRTARILLDGTGAPSPIPTHNSFARAIPRFQVFSVTW